MTTRTRIICALVLVGASLLVTAAVAFASTSARPSSMKVYINGKRMPLSKLVEGVDDYKPVKKGLLQVEARWNGTATRSGYYVVLSTTEPKNKDFATCRTGTSCLVRPRVLIRDGQEMSWTVRVFKKNGLPVAGYQVCLVGRSL